MNLSNLIERIRKEHVHIQEERRSIQQLNNDLLTETESTIKSIWIKKSQRFICDRLVVNHVIDPINLINESNKIDQADFIMGHQKFGSDEVFISNILKYLKDNPKSIAYLLYHAEKELPNSLDILCKIIISTIYNHCFLEQDKLSIIDLLEELIEIYINFYDDLKRHLYNKNSSFGIIYRHFCDELTELKTFYKLALTKPILMVLAEDNLFLDIDPNRAVMRFCQEEREKHFGVENSPEYKENLIRYQRWTILKFKHFISHFINCLKENIYAFPQSLILLMIRIYKKTVIDESNFQKFYSLFVDMIFHFLLCPAIQNPDFFDITNLHINHIARFNLMQCAQIIQMLAMSWENVQNTPYGEVCKLFDRDCLSFIMNHIFLFFQNIPKPFEIIELPHFLISDIELKIFLEYINLFLIRNNQSDNPLNDYFKKLPNSVLNFCYADDCKKSNKLELKLRQTRNKVADFPKDVLEEFSNLNIRHLLANNVDNFSLVKVLFNSRQIFKITNNDFQVHFIGLKNEQKILNNITEQDLILNENIDKTLNVIDKMLAGEINNKLFEDKSINLDQTVNHTSGCGMVDFLSNSVDISPDIELLKSLSIDESLSEVEMQSLGTLTLHLVDYSDDHSDFDNQRSNSPSNINRISPDLSLTKSNESLSNPKNIQMGHKVLSSIKSLKDKVKNFKDKDKLRSISNDSSVNFNVRDFLSQNKITFENVKAETDEIFSKYRSSKNSTENINSKIENNLIHLNESNELSEEIDYLSDIQNKLRKLFCIIDVNYIYRNYGLLNLTSKNDFMVFLKILKSKFDNVNEMATTVLIMEIYRILQDFNQEQFLELFKQLEIDLKKRHFYTIYLLKSREYLLQKLQQLQSIQLALQKEHSLTDFIIISCLVRMILEKKELNIQDLIIKFADPSTLTDEKAALVKMLLEETINNLPIQYFTDEQFTLIKQILERNLMNRIYLYAFYPNGDIDNMRDQILHQQIKQLSQIVTHNSKLLNIPAKYYTTSPWPSAQAELLSLSAYKTARDKVQCIYRCCTHIIALLGTCQNSIPSADDLLPVLIFVVIKTNVKSILSTIEYVNTFYLNDMTGEESYYWTQFCSAVEFIKTILNDQHN